MRDSFELIMPENPDNKVGMSEYTSDTVRSSSTRRSSSALLMGESLVDDCALLKNETLKALQKCINQSCLYI